jgi:hypothetical protein
VRILSICVTRALFLGFNSKFNFYKTLNILADVTETFGAKDNEHYHKNIDNQLTMDYLFESVN